jgi:hypothetical protein
MIMSELCKKECPLLLWAQSQQFAVDGICRAMIGHYLKGLDKLNEVSSDPQASILEVPLEEIAKDLRRIGPEVAEVADRAERSIRYMEEVIKEASLSCDGPFIHEDDIEEDIYSKTIVKCGGIHSKTVEALAVNQSVLIEAMEVLRETGH